MRTMRAPSAAEIPPGETSTLSRAVDGDADAFADLIREHQRMVYSIAWHFFHDSVLAEDIAQDVFLQLFQNLRGLDSEAHLVFWLRQVTTRKCIDQARWRSRRRELELSAAAHLSSEEQRADALDLERLQCLIAALPTKLRAVVTLRYQEDLQPSEIADLLKCPVNSVKSRLQRALALLRKRSAD